VLAANDIPSIPSTKVSDFTEAVQDVTGALVTNGAGITVSYNDVGNAFTVTNSGDTDASNDLTTASTAGGDLSGLFSNLQLVSDAVGNAEMANNAINTAEIVDAAVTMAKLNQSSATSGQVIKWNGSAWAPAADANSGGSVTSVGVTAPTSEFDVANSPVTGSGNIALSWDNQTTNKVFAAPDGSTGQPSFRVLAANDIPSIPSTKVSDFTEAVQDVTGALITNGAGITVSYNDVGNAFTVTNSGDTDASNDLTTASTAGGDLSGLFSNLQLGANVVTSTEIADDAVTTDKVADGNITMGKLNQSGATSGQVIKWNGAAWAPAADATGGGSLPSGTDKQTVRFNGTTLEATSVLQVDGTSVGIGEAPASGPKLTVAGPVDADGPYSTVGDGSVNSGLSAAVNRYFNSVASTEWSFGVANSGNLETYVGSNIASYVNDLNQLYTIPNRFVVGPYKQSITEPWISAVDSATSTALVLVENKSTNAAANAAFFAKVASTAAGDPYVRFSTGTRETSLGLDNSVGSDQFRICMNATLGVNVVFDANSSSNIGLAGANSSANDAITLPQGTTTRAPIVFQNGTNRTTPINGALEYDGTNFFATNSTATRFTLAKTLTATAALDFPSTSAGDFNNLTVTVTGAATGDVVAIGVPTAAIPVDGRIVYWGYVSAANTVTIRFINNADAAVDPGSGTFRVSVIRY
jgi:hypothetical protein